MSDVSRELEVKYSSVRKWVERYGTKESPGTILITDKDEIGRMKSLEKENGQLLRMVGEQQVKIVYLEALLRVAEEKLGPDFKKKANLQR